MPSKRYSPGIYVLGGGTAVGKTEVARILAEQHDLALFSTDSMQVYRGMDIGTDKVTAPGAAPPEIGGIDLVDPDENFSVGRFLAHARDFWKATEASGRGLLIVGGSGLYIKALLEGLDSEAPDDSERAKWNERRRREGIPGLQKALEAVCPGALAGLADPDNPRRLIRALEMSGRAVSPEGGKAESEGGGKPVVVLCRPRPELRRRIEKRVDRMVSSGLLEEVASLRNRFPEWSLTARQAIGYAEALAVLDGALSRKAARERIIMRTARLAKKQMTWFRRQLTVDWLPAGENEPAEALAGRVWARFRAQGASAGRVPRGFLPKEAR